MPQPKLPSQTATVSELLESATVVFRLTLAKCLPVAMFAMLTALLPSMYWLTTGKPLDYLHPPTNAAFWAIAGVALAGYQLLAGLLMIRQRALLDGIPPQARREFAIAARKWLALAVAGLIFGIALGLAMTSAAMVLMSIWRSAGWHLGAPDLIGAAVMFVGSVLLTVCLLILRPVILFDKGPVMQAIGRCVRLVRPHWSKIGAAALIALLIVVTCLVAAVVVFGIANAGLSAAGLTLSAIGALNAAFALGIEAVALVYFNALWLVLYSAASSSA